MAKEKEPAYTRIRIDFNAIQNKPDFENDPMEQIEEWVIRSVPESLREKILQDIENIRKGKTRT